MINKNRKIIAPDYLGYGSSSSIESPPSINDYAVSISEVLNQAGNYEQFDLIGFHTGCLVANELCCLIPDNIGQIIMIDIPYFTGEAQKDCLHKWPNRLIWVKTWSLSANLGILILKIE